MKKRPRRRSPTPSKVAESVFLENLGDLVRKALFLSELKEIIENTGNLDDLAMALEFKNFFFSNTNIKILDPAGKIVLTHDNSSASHISAANQDQIAFLNTKRDPLIREAGVFLVDGHLCLAAISPIVDQETFGLKGFMHAGDPLQPGIRRPDQGKMQGRDHALRPGPARSPPP